MDCRPRWPGRFSRRQEPEGGSGVKSPRVLLAAVLLLSAPFSSAQEDPGEALRDAAREGDVGRVEALLAAGADVDAPNRYGATALFFAADRGHLDVVRRLADAGAALDIEDRFYQMTALSRAAGSGHREVVFFLLARGAPGAGGLLVRASRQGDQEMLRAVLENGNFDEDALAAAREDADSEDIAALLRERTARARWRRPNSRRRPGGSSPGATGTRPRSGGCGSSPRTGCSAPADSNAIPPQATSASPVPPSRSRRAAVHGPS